MRKHSVMAWSMVVALGGFLFGFDTAVISGAEKSIQQYWHLSVFAVVPPLVLMVKLINCYDFKQWIRAFYFGFL
jgi:hypothetical protein